MPATAATSSDLTDGQAVEALHRLVSVKSLSNQEGDAVRAFVEIADAWGFRTETDAAGSGHAVIGQSTDPSREIVCLGHIDTVPGDIPVRIEKNDEGEEELWGRGSVDAKGSLMAFLAAAKRAGLPTGVSIRVVAAVGEEVAGSPGAHEVARRPAPAACFIGEPSGWDGVTLGYKGTVVCRASVVRSSAHTAGPEDSPSDDLHAWWARVLRVVDTMNEGREGIFDRVQATVREMRSQSDGLRDEAGMVCGFRFPPGVAEAELRRVVDAVSSEIDLSWDEGQEGVRSERNDPVVVALSGAIREAGGRPRPKVKTGSADISIVGPVWNCPIAAYGPGDSSLDHTPEERLGLNEYARAIGVLSSAFETLAEQFTGSPVHR